ncbi:hypothetical protein D3C76_1007550 [compost metagenome]
MGKQVETLEHHAHAASQRVHGFTAPLHGFAERGDNTAFVGFQCIDAAQQRGLARAGGADQAHHLPFGDVKVYAVQHPVAAVLFLQLANLDHAFFLRLRCCSMRRRPYTNGRLISR